MPCTLLHRSAGPRPKDVEGVDREQGLSASLIVEISDLDRHLENEQDIVELHWEVNLRDVAAPRGANETSVAQSVEKATPEEKLRGSLRRLQGPAVSVSPPECVELPKGDEGLEDRGRASSGGCSRFQPPSGR